MKKMIVVDMGFSLVLASAVLALCGSMICVEWPGLHGAHAGLLHYCLFRALSFLLLMGGFVLLLMGRRMRGNVPVVASAND